MNEMRDQIPHVDGAAQAPALEHGNDAAVNADKYHQMLALADLFDSSGDDLRTRARLGAAILADEDVAASAPLSPATFAEAEEEIRAATTGKHGLLTRSVELDADALVVRATVLTYRWIDELQLAAYQTLGSIAGRAIGYLAPEVALGGAIVSAGLIETDALDREGVAAYLSHLAESNPELMEHVQGGGGLLDGLQMRSMLTAAALTGERGTLAARGGLRALGVQPFASDAASALRDSVGAWVTETQRDEPHDAEVTPLGEGSPPSSITDLMRALVAVDAAVMVQEVGESRFIAYLDGPRGGAGPGSGVRLVSGDHSMYARQVVKAIERAVAHSEDPRVLLVGTGQGGTTAAEIAAQGRSTKFVIDQVIAVKAPAAQVPVVPPTCRVLSLEDRSDPVALLGTLVNQGVENRLTVVLDCTGTEDEPAVVVAGRAADAATHPDLVAEVTRIRELGFLA
ncbi:hypothetical protein [Nocardioides campestrisoli]|uniref:hypothetical protein n=1 Tax=Nocardioides campestrisoli TaxID=2736757 RepID=UPI0015E7A02C|nr:hypothetical protein [Nocardioides campestrisoli]